MSATATTNNAPNANNGQLTQFNPYQYALPDIPTLITQMVLQTGQGINWRDLRNKIVVTFVVKVVYDNLSKLWIDKKFMDTVFLRFLKVVRMNSLRFRKGTDILEIGTD